MLSHIITGAATQGVAEDVIPEPYRTAGINVLLDRGLITAHGFPAKRRGDFQPAAGPLAVLTHLCAFD